MRGESIFANDVGGSVLQRWRVEVAASLAGKLRGATSPLHKKMKGEALRVRHDIGKLGEEAKEAGDIEVYRKTRWTAAECATPARNIGSLGARFERDERGKWRGRAGL